MGIDAGFDIFPPLKTEKELQDWSTFLEEVKTTFKNDPIFQELKTEFQFNIGEGPTLLKNGRYFRRFSSKISGSFRDTPVENYIDQVYSIARKYFGKRIHYWSEITDDALPLYSWNEVFEAKKNAETEVYGTSIGHQ